MALALKRPDILLMQYSDEKRLQTKLFLSNIINYGESDVQSPISM